MSLTAQPTPEQIRLNDREETQYLLGNPPSWMMRYGITVMAGFVVLLLLLAYFIRYPDIVEAKITLTTAHPPIRVLARSGGRITELLVSDKEIANSGQILAIIENTANWQDVLRLEAWLDSKGLDADNLLSNLQLGSLQTAYSSFSQHWKDYHYFSTNPGTAERVAVLRKQIEQLEQINNNLTSQRTILQAEFELNTKERDRQVQMHIEKLVSDMEYEKSEATWLQQKRQLAATEATALQNQLQIRQLDGQISELRQTKSDYSNDKELALAEDLQRLHSELAAWKQAFLIVAPISGQVSLANIWSNQQAIASGEEVLAIVPVNTTNRDSTKQTILGRATLSGQGFGKIQLGMRVVIRLDGYPAQQYGATEGWVSNMSALPQKENYLVEITLPNELHTSYGKSIAFRQEMTGQARIVTEERRVIERIFDRLHDLL